MSEPSKEAMAAAKELTHRFEMESGFLEVNAGIIDRHMQPLRDEIEQLRLIYSQMGTNEQ